MGYNPELQISILKQNTTNYYDGWNGSMINSIKLIQNKVENKSFYRITNTNGETRNIFPFQTKDGKSLKTTNIVNSDVEKFMKKLENKLPLFERVASTLDDLTKIIELKEALTKKLKNECRRRL